METIRGGTGSYLDAVVPAQVGELGPDNVVCVVPRQQAHDLTRVPAACTILIDYERQPYSLVRSMVNIRRILREQRPDILHIHSSYAGVLVRLPYLLMPCDRPKIVYCAHAWSFTMESATWRRLLYEFIERILARCTDAIVNISDFELKAAVAAGIPARKCVRIYNGVLDVSVDAKARSPEMLWDPSYLNLLFVGRFDRQKGLDILLSAMRRLKRADLRLYLIGAEFRSTNLVQVLPANVVSLGWLPPDKLDTYYSAADAVVVPSRWEGFGLVAAEAMRNGTPVICSDRGALPELVIDGESGMVVALTPTERLVELLDALDRGRLARMRAAARARYEKLFTADAMNRQLLDLYYELLGTQRGEDRSIASGPHAGEG